jgi:general secretion pathway protein D
VKRLAAAAVAMVWFLAAQAADEVTLDFVNADIDTVVRAVAKMTKRNLIVDPRVKGTLNIVTNKPVSPALGYQILLSALRLQGYTIVDSEGVAIVLPEADAKLHATPVNPGKATARGDQPVTQTFTLRHESAAQVLPVVRPLVATNNSVTAYANNNTLVVTDYAENIERIGRIIQAIDLPRGEVEAIPLAHASALDLAPTVTRLFAEAAEASQKVTVVADARNNLLLVRTDSPSRLSAVRQLVATLDRQDGAGNIHLVYLKNAEATKVAQTLRAILTGDTSSSGQSGSSATAAVSAAAASPVGNATAATGSNATGAGGIVQADAVSNALIITAAEPVYNNLRRIIDGLDRRRAQVQVEALIAEISADRAAELGIQWQSANTPSSSSSSTVVFGGTNFTGGSNILTAASSIGSVSRGLNIAIGGGTITLPGSSTPILNLSMLARALESYSGTNILSTPNIVTLDNEEAKIVVGQNVPFVTGQYTNTGSSTTTVNPFQTISRQDVGLTLRIKPQISEGGAVRLQIYQESSSVVASTASNPSGPTTSKRSIETAALVDDGAIIALGGLVEDSMAAATEKVPLLGDIPVVGQLFRYDTRQRTKTNLVVFLRPKILRDADSYKGFTADRYEQMIGEQQRRPVASGSLIPGDYTAPQLPAPARTVGDSQTAREP